MVDFSKLRNPEFMAKIQSRIQDEQTQMDLQRKSVLKSIQLLVDAEDSLSDEERSFVRSLRMQVVVKRNTPTEAQAKWMHSLCKKVRGQSDESEQQVPRFTGYPRNS